MSWVTPEKALVYTGKALTTEQLDAASSIITIYAGVTEDQPEESISARDRTWLAMATAYQAAWTKPGLLEYRESHTSTSADGVQVSRESDSQIMLAPLASRALRNLSWIGNATTSQLPLLPPKGSILSERADPYHTWKDLNI